MRKRTPQAQPNEPNDQNHAAISAPSPRVQLSQASLNISSGPIPSPDILANYERHFPGLANRIITAFEAEYATRHRLEEAAMHGDIEAMRLTHGNHRRGQILGFLICMGAICAGTWLVYMGHDWAGGTIGSIGLASVIGAYYKSQSKEDAPPQSG